MGGEMNANLITYYHNYTPVGDVLTMALCFVFVVLIKISYINNTKAFKYLKVVVAFLFASAANNIIYHVLINHLSVIPVAMIYFFRIAYHLCIFAMLLTYVYYMKEPLRLDERHDQRYGITGFIYYIILFILEFVGTATHIGFYIDDSNNIHTGIPIFPIGYIAYLGLIGYVLVKYRERVFKQIVSGVLITIGISILMIGIQQIHGQSSYTVATFSFPVIVLMYLVHSNPYNMESGALGINAFYDFIKNEHQRKREFLLMSLYMPEFDKGTLTYPKDIMSTIRYFVVSFFNGANLFQISGGHLILGVDIRKNPTYKEHAEKIIGEFNKVYPIYKRDYKIISLKSEDRLGLNKDYISFIDFVRDRMPINSIHKVFERDIDDFYKFRFIQSQLDDIEQRKDLNDERVEVYCQPVFNIKNGIYDTAEALMRLNLPEIGMVFPDQFIPIAEQNGCIKTLTRIILNKTCRQIKIMIGRGYNVHRISVNFSIFDVRENDFCMMVEKIIRESGISNDQIAIEITESQNESDFELIKKKINELKGTGIKFYLDDFGTGYSNFERIMELPFDIIKFDRSLVIASSNDAKMKDMVSHLAKMFSDMNYSVLYEGIENDADEERCKDMSAQYLQGYKYSKPIPIKQLTEYFEKKSG